MATRAVRFSPEEERLIQAFLDSNPIFDFSTLARAAILHFMENPEINLKAISTKSIQVSKGRGAVLTKEARNGITN